jgi:hypothetical protein
MAPRFRSSESTGIVGAQPYTAVVAFKDMDTYQNNPVRTLTYLGGGNSQGYRLQYVTDSFLSHSGFQSDTGISCNALLQQSAHLWASTYLGGVSTTQYWNGAFHSLNVGGPAWNTVPGPLQVGAAFGNAFFENFQGGIKFVLITNRALTQSEVASVARWSWDTHGVGVDLMNFSPDAWTKVIPGQLYWTPLPQMQPLTSRTVRFLIDINNTHTEYRSIVRFGSSDGDALNDRMPAIYIDMSLNRLRLSMTQSSGDGNTVYDLRCPTELVGPSLVSVVYSRTSMATFINSVKQTDSRCSPSTLPTIIADTDNSRAARRSQQSAGGFSLRSLQLLDYAMTDLEAQAPIIISVTPQVLLASHSSVTVIGSPFVVGAACSALFLDGSTSTNCSVVSAVEIVVIVNASVPSARPSMLMVITHYGLTFRAPISCFGPYFVSNGSCSFVPADSTKDSSSWISSDAVLPMPATPPVQQPSIFEVVPEFFETSDRFSLSAILIRIQLGCSSLFFSKTFLPQL